MQHVLVFVAIFGLSACRGPSAPVAASAPAIPAQPELGVVRADLDDAAKAAWLRGKVEFLKVYTAEQGLGPYFNAKSCAACHDKPVNGGHSDMAHDARLVIINGDVTGMPRLALAGFVPLQPPAGTKVSRHRPPPLFGLGLIEAIPDAHLPANCGRDQALGIHGIANVNPGQKLHGKFGYKAHTATILDFVADAMNLEMGITNPEERDPRLQHDDDAVPDPEAPTAVAASIADYVRGLAPPSRLPFKPADEALFDTTGCATCHRAETAPGVPAFTDVCLHDLGPAFATGLQDFLAGPSQWRTAPLWGLRYRTRYFHDDRAETLDAAIRMHEGEAAKVRDRYTALPPADQARLRAFLQTL